MYFCGFIPLQIYKEIIYGSILQEQKKQYEMKRKKNV